MAKATTKAAPLQLGPLTVSTAQDDINRMALLLWGPAGTGKSTFAATAPGTKLWLSFGDQEHVSVRTRKDVIVTKPYELGLDDLFKHVQNDNPLGLDQFLSANTEVHTVVVDSLTAIAYRALQKAVRDGVGGSRTFTPSMETPGISAYGGRNAIVLEVITGLLRVTAKHNVHCIVTAHEADPTTHKDERGNDVIDYIGVMLGGQIVNNVTWRLSEIWYMSSDGNKRRLAVRPTRLRRPMKTRMFSAHGPAEFELDYDAERPDKGQATIASWFEAWEQSTTKLPVPARK